tara:strand:- start:5179 stop:5370 length:192 start_codon:yes stop_codon:yes gene_type:complete
MPLDKLFRTLGVLMMVFAFISGLYVKITAENGAWDIDSRYSFKIGLFLIGAAIYYLARKRSTK